jgi:hypothetical protein
VNDPETLEALPHKTTIYHILLDPNSHKSRGPATAKSLYEESQALMFGGGDTTANVVMIGTFYLLKRPDLIKKLKDELKEYWPELGPGREPKLSVLEEMPFLVNSASDKYCSHGILTIVTGRSDKGISSHWTRPSEWTASNCSRNRCNN